MFLRLNDPELEPARASRGLLPEIGGWVVLSRPALKGHDALPQVDFALLHPDRGVALVDVGLPGADAVPDVQRGLRQALLLELPSWLPVVHVAVPADGLAELPRLLQAAFAAEPPLISRDPGWIEEARRVLAPAAAASLAVVSHRPAAAPPSRRGLVMIALSLGLAVLLGAAVLHFRPGPDGTASSGLETSPLVPAAPTAGTGASNTPPAAVPTGREASPATPVAPALSPAQGEAPAAPRALPSAPARPSELSAATLSAPPSLPPPPPRSAATRDEAPQELPSASAPSGEAAAEPTALATPRPLEPASPLAEPEPTASRPAPLAKEEVPPQPTRLPPAVESAQREAIGLRCTELITRLQLREPLSNADRQFLRSSCARRR